MYHVVYEYIMIFNVVLKVETSIHMRINFVFLKIARGKLII